jgi:hypothetical protein
VPPPTPIDYENRETIPDDPLPQDVQLVSVSLQENTVQKTSGRVYVPFTPEGDDGSHVVLVRLRGAAGDAPEGRVWVRYNAMTRSFEISETELTWPKIAGDQ